MKEGAQAEAHKLGAKLMTASGKKDGDTGAQITAIDIGCNIDHALHRIMIDGC